MEITLRHLDSARFRRGLGILLTQTPPTKARKQLFSLTFPRDPFLPASGQGQRLFQEPPVKSKFLAFTALVTILAVMAAGCDEHSPTESGDATTLLNRGKTYAADDAEKAFNCYLKAAQQGNAEAQFLLGNCFSEANGTYYNSSEAVEWYRKSAEQGYAEAQFSLASNLHNHIEAAEWFRKAADQGLASAQYSLGVCYAEGKGVLKDFTESAKWYNKAAEQGDAIIQFRVGRNYQFDEPQDPIEAAKWFRKAADQGLAPAQDSLADCYRLGIGVPKDVTLAYTWYNLAAANDFRKKGSVNDFRKKGALKGTLNVVRASEKMREEIAKEMTAGQIFEAQKFSREWKPVKDSDK